MNANEVKKLDWTTVSDWRELTISDINYYGQYVGKEDVDFFVEKRFKEVAKQLGIPYKELEPILKEKNAEFYAEEQKIFEKIDGYTKYHPLMKKLKAMLKVPVVPKVMLTPQAVVV